MLTIGDMDTNTSHSISVDTSFSARHPMDGTAESRLGSSRCAVEDGTNLIVDPTLPITGSIYQFISQHSYNLPSGKHLAVVDDVSIYYFDHTTIHSTTFKYQYRKFHSDYSEYGLVDGDGKKYVVFTLMAARVLIPGLVIPDPPAVIVPVQTMMTLIYQHGVIEDYPISNRTPVLRWHRK